MGVKVKESPDPRSGYEISLREEQAMFHNPLLGA